MTIWFLALLAFISTLVCLSSGMRARQGTPLSAVQRFKRRMDLIAPPRLRGGRWVVVPETHNRLGARALRRRRARQLRTLLALVGVAVFSGVLAIFSDGLIRELHLVVDGVLVFYVAMLREAKRRRDERTDKVSAIGPRRPAPELVFDEPANLGGRHA